MKSNYLVIVPVVCGAVMTRKCIDSVLLQDVPTVCFVIDNASEDCGHLLRSYGRNITLIRKSSQISLNTVWNEALDMAFDSLKYDHALVINNDTILRPDTYRLLEADGGQFVSGVGVGDLTQLDKVNASSRSPHPSFSCFMIRREVWKKVGKFDDRYWAYCSDQDYHLRMHRMGVEAYAIGVPFFHVGSGTLKFTEKINYAQHKMICARADSDRALFLEQHGFPAGSPEYYQQFSER